MNNKHVNALVLSGGGAKGSFQAGAIKVLKEQGLLGVDLVLGISVGALNGIMVAVGKENKLEAIWKGISPSQVMKTIGPVRKIGAFILHKIGIHRAPMGYFDNSPLRSLISRHVLGVRLKRAFQCGVVDIQTGEYKSFYWKAGTVVSESMVEIILASTAIPVTFDPVEVDVDGENHLLVDGGVRSQTPIGDAVDRGVESAIIITCGRPAEAFDRRAKDIVDVAKNAVSALINEIFDKDLREFRKINSKILRMKSVADVVLSNTPSGTMKGALSEDPADSRTDEQVMEDLLTGGKRYVSEITIMPYNRLPDSLDFTAESAIEGMAHGREAAREAIEAQGFKFLP